MTRGAMGTRRANRGPRHAADPTAAWAGTMTAVSSEGKEDVMAKKKRKRRARAKHKANHGKRPNT